MADVDDFDDFDPTPYGGGYDINLTYGRPIPPSEETCYAPNADSSSGVDYARPNYSGSARPSQFGYGGRPDPSEEQSYVYGYDEGRDPKPYRAEQTEDYGRSDYSGYGRSEEQSYGYGYEERRDPKPYREEQTEDYGGSEYSGYGRRPDRSEEQSYGYGYEERRETKPYREEGTEDYEGGYRGRTRYGQKKEDDDDSDDNSDEEKKERRRYRKHDYSDD